MRVKRLEIQGFKSFKDKTVIHFDHSITGIVGPNGCGKSNIVDAFFWVMGEQSYKHMRGTSSEDLIFNGSSKYSPLGLAEATMVLESTVESLDSEPPAGASVQDIPLQLKTKEISVTRRLYRSGEGEYFINGVLSRLKDIQELFMDTGVGAKGYSVIEQGQIGKIVNSKPDERRLLIEDAAGIAKYKARKKESLRKMEATQTNLSRLTDIIQEIEKSLDSLERQAQKARHYRKYKDELSDKEMNWGRRKYQLLQTKLENLRKSRDGLEQSLAGLRAELQVAENTIEIERIHLLEETKAAEDLQTQIQAVASHLSQEKSSLDLSRRRQGDLAQQLANLQNEQQDLDAAIQSGNIRLLEAQAEAEAALIQVQEAAQQAEVLLQDVQTQRSQMGQARTHLEAQRREQTALSSQISNCTSRVASLDAKAQAAQAQKERLDEQIILQQERVEGIVSELEQSRVLSGELTARKSQLADSKKDLLAQKECAAKNLKEQEGLRSVADRSYSQLISKLQGLQELDASYEGLAEGPRSILEWAKNNGRSEISALTDAVQVDSGYEVVFQSWLENRAEQLITSNASLALEQLERTTQGKKGRVAFQLSRGSFGTPNSPTKHTFEKVKELLTSAGFEVCGELAQFLKIAPELKSALQPLLQNVCVVQSCAPLNAFLADLSDAAAALLQGWNFASLEGTILESTGLLRGGSLDAAGSLVLLRRKQQIETLKVEVTQSELKRAAAHAACEEAGEKLSAAQTALDALQAQSQVLEIELAALNRDIHQTERAQTEANSQLLVLRRDLEKAQTEEHSATEDREQIQEELAELTSSRIVIEDAVLQAQAALGNQETTLREQEQSLSTIKISEASLQERSRSLKREVESTRTLISDQSRRLQEIIRTLDRASQERSEFSGGEAQLAENIEKLTHQLAAARAQLAEIKDRIEQRNALVSTAMEKTKVLHKQSEQQNTDSTQVALDTEKLSGELSHIILNLEEKYGAGCLQKTVSQQIEMGEVITTEQLSWGEISEEEERILGEEVEKLRERIRRLGEVNVMAIEEYEQLKKRYDFLLTERADLNQSLNNLQDAIDHINKTSEERFKKAFESIAERFERLFPIIFGGGSAKLSLVYPEGSQDILDAGVDILAQPPGKKVANITLLSGGEKALTAVSLIFAIFMVKPSPFCVLDEVDAPLDDANIGKFNALLKEMSAKSQFILITHNKKTMELNDTLYGVTMEEPGVSKMVSIEMH